MDRREFLQVLASASAAGLPLAGCAGIGATGGAGAGTAGQAMYDIPRFGNVSLLHFTDCHAQLTPIYFREPSVNIGIAGALGKAPHLVGEHLLKAFGVKPGSPLAHAFTYLDFHKAARTYGKVGGFAHLATLVKQLRASRPGALLLDGGDTWQGSATALWTDGQDMVDACKLLGVDMMSPHWEFTLGAKRVKEIIDKDFKGKIEFLAQNVKTTDFEDPVFKPYEIRSMNGVAVAVIGQAFPYTPIANPRYMTPDWSFGIQEDRMQKMVDEARSKGAQVVVVLSHNGMDVDLKMASRVTGIDAILGGHTHDGVPQPVIVSNARGKTLVTNAGSHGKFLGVLDLDVKGGKVSDYRYRLLPVFANLLPADPQMQAYIDKVRAPYKTRLEQPLAVLLAPLLGGAVLLTLGLALDALAAWWRGEWRRWALGDAALLVVYLGLLAAFVWPSGLWLAAAGALHFCFGHVVLARRAAAGVGAIGELVEKSLQIMINTLSFARVGAFALAHAGLSSAIVALMDAAESLVAKALVLVLGNAVVIVLEVMVVSIQTTRLVLFEFFTRFMQGRGRAFRPLPPPPFSYQEN